MLCDGPFLRLSDDGTFSCVSYTRDCRCQSNQVHPLHEAALNGSLQELELILRVTNHDDCNRINVEGLTPMHFAAKGGHAVAIEMLFQLGGEHLDTVSCDGNTAMVIAADNGRDDAIETLMRLGSQAIDTPDKSGWTPMHFAAASRDVNCIATLVRLGSQALNTPAKSGHTPLDAAIASSIAPHIHVDEDRYNSWNRAPVRAFKTEQTKACLRALRILGAESFTTPIEELAPLMRTALCDPIDETVAAELRFRVYFAVSLTRRLIFDLQRTANTFEATRRVFRPDWTNEAEVFQERDGDNHQDNVDDDDDDDDDDDHPILRCRTMLNEHGGSGRFIVVEGFQCDAATSILAQGLVASLKAQAINSASMPLVSSAFGETDLRAHFEQQQSPAVQLQYLRFTTMLASEQAKSVLWQGTDVVMDGYWPRIVARCAANKDPMLEYTDHYPPDLIVPDVLILLTSGKPPRNRNRFDPFDRWDKDRKIPARDLQAHRRFLPVEVDTTDLDADGILQQVLVILSNKSTSQVTGDSK